ncbi:hypothetical protein K501DRAFT_272519 [Backusella circina FSU 941]|nr:hypothetical protein K501DRAFT_272519 [Backusella circina FSU 941]
MSLIKVYLNTAMVVICFYVVIFLPDRHTCEFRLFVARYIFDKYYELRLATLSAFCQKDMRFDNIGTSFVNIYVDPGFKLHFLLKLSLASIETGIFQIVTLGVTRYMEMLPSKKGRESVDEVLEKYYSKTERLISRRRNTNNDIYYKCVSVDHVVVDLVFAAAFAYIQNHAMCFLVRFLYKDLLSYFQNARKDYTKILESPPHCKYQYETFVSSYGADGSQRLETFGRSKKISNLM